MRRHASRNWLLLLLLLLPWYRMELLKPSWR
jgi:hypothetical protein